MIICQSCRAVQPIDEVARCFDCGSDRLREATATEQVGDSLFADPNDARFHLMQITSAVSRLKHRVADVHRRVGDRPGALRRVKSARQTAGSLSTRTPPTARRMASSTGIGGRGQAPGSAFVPPPAALDRAVSSGVRQRQLSAITRAASTRSARVEGAIGQMAHAHSRAQSPHVQRLNAEVRAADPRSLRTTTALRGLTEAFRADGQRVVADLVAIQHEMARVARENDGDPEGELARLGQFVETLTDGAMAFTDLIAIADASYTMATVEPRSGAVHSPEPFLTTSAWAGVTSVVPVLLSIHGLYLAIQRGDGSAADAARATGAAAIGAAPAAAQATAFFAQMAGAGSVATVAAQAFPVATAISGLYTTVTQSIELHHLDLIGARYDACRANEGFAALVDGSAANKASLEYLVQKFMGKMRRRSWRAGAGVTSGVATMGSGAIGAAMVAGAVTGAAVPVVGWICLGVATVTGLGLFGYKIGRRVHKVRKLDAMRQAGRPVGLPIPDWCETSGDYHRYRIAMFIFFALTQPDVPDQYRIRAKIWSWILFGGTTSDAMQAAREMGIPGIMAFIKG